MVHFCEIAMDRDSILFCSRGPQWSLKPEKKKKKKRRMKRRRKRRTDNMFKVVLQINNNEL